MADKVLVGNSAWIDFFRMKDPELHKLVATLLREGGACGTGVIVLYKTSYVMQHSLRSVSLGCSHNAS